MLTVLTPAESTKLTTVTLLKAELGISGSAEDAALGVLIDQATDIIRRFTAREFGQAAYRETIIGHGGTILMLTHTPIVSVQVVASGGSPIADYVVEDPDAGFLQRQSGWASGELIGWNIAPFYSPDRGYPNFSVDYTAGWKLPNDTGRTLPHDAERMALELSKLLYRTKGRDNSVSQKQVDDLSLTFRNLGETDDRMLAAAGVLGIARSYQRVVSA